MAEKEITEKVKLIFMFSRFSSEGKETQLWLPASDYTPGETTTNQAFARARAYHKLSKKPSPGMVYEIDQVQGGTTVFPSTIRYSHLISDDSLLVDWSAEHRAEKIRDEARKIEKKAKETDSLLDTLHPLRMKMKNMLPDRRRALLAVVLDYLLK